MPCSTAHWHKDHCPHSKLKLADCACGKPSIVACRICSREVKLVEEEDFRICYSCVGKHGLDGAGPGLSRQIKN